MNTAIFGGRLGRDAELRKTNGGDSVCNFPLAVDVGTKAEPRTLWVEGEVWGKRAEAINQYLVKGMKLTIIGRLDVGMYHKKDGTAAVKVKVTCNEIDMHGTGEKREQSAPVTQKAPSSMTDDDIPF